MLTKMLVVQKYAPIVTKIHAPQSLFPKIKIGQPLLMQVVLVEPQLATYTEDKLDLHVMQNRFAFRCLIHANYFLEVNYRKKFVVGQMRKDYLHTKPAGR